MSSEGEILSFSGQTQHNNKAEQIISYIKKSSGLALVCFEDHFEVSQILDGKCLGIAYVDIKNVIQRVDSKGEPFLQINFGHEKKILLTDTLIGFRPSELSTINMDKLPKVVTTPDIVSVFEAIQEALHADSLEGFEEIEVLRRVFESVLAGGEEVGFDLTREREWMSRIPAMSIKASA